MRFSSSSLAVALLVALAGPVRAEPPPSDPAPEKSGISVSLVEKRKLKLVRPAGAKAPALDGELEVTVANRGASTIRLVPKHDVHGLVFAPRGGGPPFVVVHECQCVHDAQSD